MNHKRILQLAQKYRDIVATDLNINDDKIIEVIFFPDMCHAPIVRIDGSGLTEVEAAKLEKESPFVMVRLPELTHSQIKGKQKDLLEFEKLQDLSECLELQNLVKDVASQIDWRYWTIWEVEVEGKQIIVRCFSEQEKENMLIDGIRYEFVNDVQAENSKWLLQVFDDAKRKKKLFLAHLKDLLTK